MKWILFGVLLFPFTNYSQGTVAYHSKLTEYNIENSSISKYEWINRDIIVSPGKIVVKTSGKDATDFQYWIITNVEYKAIDRYNLSIYYTYLASSDNRNENTSVFTLFANKLDHVDIIEWQFPDIDINEIIFQTHRLHLD